jgi:hypothetical protein
MPAIPLGDVVVNSWKQTPFEQSKKDSRRHESWIILDETLADHRDGPEDHNESKPHAGSKTLHHHIAGNFGCDVERKENRQTIIVLKAMQLEIFLKIIQAGISNVGSIQKT